MVHLLCIEHHPICQAVTFKGEAQPGANDDEQVKIISSEVMWLGIKDTQRAINLACAKHHGHAQVGTNVKGGTRRERPHARIGGCRFDREGLDRAHDVLSKGICEWEMGAGTNAAPILIVVSDDQELVRDEA